MSVAGVNQGNRNARSSKLDDPDKTVRREASLDPQKKPQEEDGARSQDKEIGNIAKGALNSARKTKESNLDVRGLSQRYREKPTVTSVAAFEAGELGNSDARTSKEGLLPGFKKVVREVVENGLYPALEKTASFIEPVNEFVHEGMQRATGPVGKAASGFVEQVRKARQKNKQAHPEPTALEMAVKDLTRDVKSFALAVPKQMESDLGIPAAKTVRAVKDLTTCMQGAGNLTFGKHIVTRAFEGAIKKEVRASLVSGPEFQLPKTPLTLQASNPLSEIEYFHATSLEGAMGILRKGTIDRSLRNDGFYVGTKPNLEFGNVVVVLNKKAAEKNIVAYTAPIKDNREIGFLYPIEATEETVVAIAVGEGIDREFLASQIAQVAKRRIPVIPLDRIYKELWERSQKK